ncbi:phage major capsid protein [Deinococcus sp. QL22]|uniref:phage major capsid protein n=1 Tax=Deinococcus sp. QL22 TaxID=2939437 RepID=UPI002017A91F|nr:phage major capsid protein [Deinococcus sp. QL22]UQN10374.1 phage major capsid protein [Deinococcus sp. QL22]UQN10508.1 phage major capsid protein [Deinococcus sp. QL22]
MSYKIAKRTDLADKGLYQDAKAAGVNLADYMQIQADEGKISEEFYNPDDSTPAFKQVLGSLGVDPKGRDAARPVEDVFMQDPSKRVLFPEYIATRYRDLSRPMRNELTVEDLVTTITPVRSGAYTYGVITEEHDAGANLSRVAEAAEFPTITVQMGEQSIRLLKYGGKLKVSYEVIRRSSVSVMDRWIGAVVRRALRNKVNAALAVVLNGDGNNGAAPNLDVAGPGYTVADIVELSLLAGDYGADPTILAGDRTELGKLLTLPIFTGTDSTTASDFRETGRWPAAFGMMPKRAPKGSLLDGAAKLLALDPEMGLEMAFDPSMDLVENDKIIERQIEFITFSEMIGFGKPELGVGVTAHRSS